LKARSSSETATQKARPETAEAKRPVRPTIGVSHE
jgi:hypothetical protein